MKKEGTAASGYVMLFSLAILMVIVSMFLVASAKLTIYVTEKEKESINFATSYGGIYLYLVD